MEQALPVFQNFKREKEELPATLSTTYDSLTIFWEPPWHDNYGYRHHRLACHAKSKKKFFSCAVGAALSNMTIIGPAGLGPGGGNQAGWQRYGVRIPAGRLISQGHQQIKLDRALSRRRKIKLSRVRRHSGSP
ncbi:hypothetical protein [Burkholderia arboris]|uniref:hypothetical protein n=1 Tax=Burkholderia arboris TaxID=488730 RepID=UPI0030F2966B